ncbi:DUF4123 domain-containing protein [Phyllobacterium sp. TAF24]|uniref:DUF4123 domain-containing protein n=1 Tax=Phyllobacterium sp. TAF24 TaxID=3233068 RepID=UPI003F9D3CBC
MQKPESDASSSNEIARALSVALDRMPRPIFAVLDGAHFDDLEDELGDAGIKSRSLFLKGGDDNIRRDGPWMVALDDNHVRDRIEELALKKPCAVFWSCPDGEQALWQHLRSINKVLVPDDQIPGNDGSLGRPVKYEWVLFRHWDPNVLAQVLPALEAAQYTRFVGAAAEVLFAPSNEWRSALMRAGHSRELPRPKIGPLKLTPDVIQVIASRRLEASRARRATYLRQTCKDEVANASEGAIAEHIRISEETGLKLGLESEAAHCRWAFIVCKSNGRVLKSKDAQNYISNGGDHPDNRVKQFMSDTLRWLEQSNHKGIGQ